MYVHYILLGLLGYTQKAEAQGEYDIRTTSLLELTCTKLMTLISMALLVHWVPGSCLLDIDGIPYTSMGTIMALLPYFNLFGYSETTSSGALFYFRILPDSRPL